MYNLLDRFIILNGIYDILCALSIMKYIPFFSYFHLSMIEDYDYNNELFERFFAYWIFTYGIIRLVFYDNYNIIGFTYCIEAILFARETYVSQTIVPYRGNFVILSCILLTYLCFIQYQSHQSHDIVCDRKRI